MGLGARGARDVLHSWPRYRRIGIQGTFLHSRGAVCSLYYTTCVRGSRAFCDNPVQNCPLQNLSPAFTKVKWSPILVHW